MANISLNKDLISKEDFDKLVNKNFRQLIGNQPSQINFTIDDFFELYDSIFDIIPREGETNSHRFILERESEYLGVRLEEVDIQALIDEITSLRQQLLDANSTLLDLTKQ